VRLLFDEQLAEALCDLLEDVFPGSLHVRLIGLGGAGDEHVWHAARERDCVLVTRDGDFHRLSVLRGAPPKVVWIRIGNCGTAEIAAGLRRHSADIQRFAQRDDDAVLELGGA
jgi:predicted nuclease of predicted toxin-antitoxin system